MEVLVSLEASWSSGLGSGGAAAFILALPPPGDGTHLNFLRSPTFSFLRPGRSHTVQLHLSHTVMGYALQQPLCRHLRPLHNCILVLCHLMSLQDQGSSEVSQLCPTLCDPMDCKPARLLHPWTFLGKDTGMRCHFLLQEIFLTQGSNLGFLHCRQSLYPLSHQGRSLNVFN